MLEKVISVIIPLSPVEWIPNEVLDSIQVPYRLFVRVSETERENPSKIGRIVNVRNELKVLPTSEYTLLLDSDIIIPNNWVRDAIVYLDNFPNIAAVSCAVCNIGDLEGTHINISTLLIRTECLDKVRFKIPDHTCECIEFVKDIRMLGKTVRFLDNRIAKHIYNG